LSFQNLKLIEPLLKALEVEGYTVPTPIQEQSIPIILSRKDLLGCAQTGTGKTAAFAIPLLQLLCEEAAGLKADTGLRSARPIKALVLTPTRELAIQIGESFGAYGKFTGLKNLVIFGGVPQHSQVQALQRGIDILVATPGRLLDLIDQRYVNLRDIQFFVLDEADRMLDMGFVHDVKKIIGRLPQKRQTLFFSATMPPEIQKLAGTILTNPSKVEVTPATSTAETVQQSIYFVEKKDKRSLLLHVLKTQEIPTALVFTRTKHGADKVAQGLSQAGIRAEAIHGNKSQNARQRALENFKNRQTRILVATDIAARGIDIEELTHVINYELPNVPETYIHRIGRTGRAGASGIALSFCDAEETEFLHDIQKLIGQPIPVAEDHPHAMHASLSFRPSAPAQGIRQSGQAGGRNGTSGRGRDNGSSHQRKERPGLERNSVPGNRRPADQGHQQSGRPPRPLQKRNEHPEAEALNQPVERQKVHQPVVHHPVAHQPIAQQKPKPRPSEAKRVSPPVGDNKKENPADPGLPFPVNQSSGEERW
jgi:ATP-dependent RNA helicase RhlE